MSDLEHALLAAWRRVHPRLLADAHELARRLARRRRAVLTRPPRAWCLAIRASDHRLTPLQHSPSSAPHSSQQILLTADFVRRLCAPVTLDPPGETLAEVAKKLGTTPLGLRTARLKKIFHVHHVRGLGGACCDVPLLYTPHPLDPAGRDFLPADPAWSWTARGLAARLPDDFQQTLTRVENFRPHVPATRYAEHVHPEVRDAPAPRTGLKYQRLPPPEPDPVWYKWSRSGHFLGDDPSNWRKSPDDLGERPPRYLPRRQRRKKPRPSQSAGSLHFRGWSWLCPTCGRPCRLLYYPLPPINLLPAHELPRLAQIIDIVRVGANPVESNDILPLPLRESFRQGVRGDRGESSGPVPRMPSHLPLSRGTPWERAGVRVRVESTCANSQSPEARGSRMAPSTPAPPIERFACYHCHRIRPVGRFNHADWNHLITYLTAGLLYGREVPDKPAGYRFERKRPYRPTLNAPPPRRRQHVLKRLLEGRTMKEIAAEMHVSVNCVAQHLKLLYQQHNVSGRAALARKLNVPPPAAWTTKREQIRRHLAAGLWVPQIAARMNLTEHAVRNQLTLLRRSGQKISPPPRLTGRAQLPALLLAGLTTKEIARRLHLTPTTVTVYLNRLYRQHGLSGPGAHQRLAESLRRTIKLGAF